MNALAPSASDPQFGLLAAIHPAQPVDVANQSAAFVNLIHVLLDSTQQTSASVRGLGSDSSDVAAPQTKNPTQPIAHPDQIAEALVRSMLGQKSSPSAAVAGLVEPLFVGNQQETPSVEPSPTQSLPPAEQASPQGQIVAASQSQVIKDAFDPKTAAGKPDAQPATPTLRNATLKKDAPKLSDNRMASLSPALGNAALPQPSAIPVDVPQTKPPSSNDEPSPPDLPRKTPLFPASNAANDALRSQGQATETAFTARITPMRTLAQSDAPAAPQDDADAPTQAIPLTPDARVGLEHIDQEQLPRDVSFPQLQQSPLGQSPSQPAALAAPSGKPGPSHTISPNTPDAKTKPQDQDHSGNNHDQNDDDQPVHVLAATASANTGDFHHGADDNAQWSPLPSVAVSAPSSRAQPTQGPRDSAPTVSDALRASESMNAASPIPATTPVQEIAVRIARPDAPPVDLHVTERAGEIHVAVRTPDSGLQTSLRQDLGSLTNSLERAGYHAETFVPREGTAPAARSQEMNHRNDHQDSQSDAQSRGNNRGSSQGRQQQQRNPNPRTWREELENQP